VVPSQLTHPAIDFSTLGGAFAIDPTARPPAPPVVPVLVPPLPPAPPLGEPPVVDPAVVPPDVLPPVVPLPVPPRLIVPVTLVASELVPLLELQAASATLIAAMRYNFHEPN
jgi:hypothetical protein